MEAILARVRVSMLLGVVLVIAGVALLTVGLLGWRQRLPRNRFAGIRTPATLRSDAAFIVANRVAAPPVLAAGALCAVGGGLVLGSTGPALMMIVSVTGAGVVGLLLAGGLLGHRAATAMPPRPAGCAECTCCGGSCTAT
ncbi:MAG TPA: SdpI family protein [Pseudonocardiaceae bacterium]|nr:SdpI family protein [Pseudonocardiaceae bacterium]